MSATDYARDKVQTGGESNALTMSSVRRERFEQRNDVSMRNFIINAQEDEIEHLDCAVFKLHPVQQEIVIDRFYDGLTMREVCCKRHYSKRNVIRMTNKAIDDITCTFNLHNAQSLENSMFDISVNVGTPCHLNE